MKNITKIVLIIAFICFLLSAFGLIKIHAQSYSPMDVVEKEIKIEYKRHQADFILQLAIELAYSGRKKGKTIIIDRKYNYNVKTISKPIYYTYGEGDTQSPAEYKITFKSKSRSYTIDIKGEHIKLSSENLSFDAGYNIKDKEVKLSVKINDGSFGGEFKHYTYIYFHDIIIGDKLEDSIVRNALGRSNSIAKSYGQNKNRIN